jgi:hypothetical protein
VGVGERLLVKSYLGKRVCITEVELERMGAGQERTDRQTLRFPFAEFTLSEANGLRASAHSG